jgi:type II secretory pathway pseudopilin PulG
MGIETIVTILVIALLIAALVGAVYFYLKEKTLNEIRADVYQLFLKAEHMYVSGAGKQKMEFVIQKARSLLPSWAQLFITEDVLRKVVQIWFDAVKDLLDDGKLNRSAKAEE